MSQSGGGGLGERRGLRGEEVMTVRQGARRQRGSVVRGNCGEEERSGREGGTIWIGLYAASGNGYRSDPGTEPGKTCCFHSLCSVGPGGAADGADLAGGAVRRQQHPAVGQHMAGLGGGAACTGGAGGGIGDGDQCEEGLQRGGR